MSRKHANLPDQKVMLFILPLRPPSRDDACADAGTRIEIPLPFATGGQLDGASRPLANADAGRVAGVRDTNREDWFLDPHANEPDAAA